MKQQIHESMNPWVSRWINEKQWIHDSMKQWNNQKNGINESVSDSMNQWKYNESMTKWSNETITKIEQRMNATIKNMVSASFEWRVNKAWAWKINCVTRIHLLSYGFKLVHGGAWRGSSECLHFSPNRVICRGSHSLVKGLWFVDCSVGGCRRAFSIVIYITWWPLPPKTHRNLNILMQLGYSSWEV